MKEEEKPDGERQQEAFHGIVTAIHGDQHSLCPSTG